MIISNVIIAGAPRCGTTSVFDWLADHPEVCASSVKETRYFIDEDNPLFNKKANYRYHGIEKYDSYFKNCGKNGAKVALEATPDYLYQRTALEALPALNPQKIIFLLRKPSDRIFSFIKFAQNNMSVIDNDLSFAEVIASVESNPCTGIKDYLVQNVINYSRYVDFVRKWIDIFGRERILVFLFEHLKENPKDFMKTLSRSIGIDAAFWDDYAFKKSNEAYHVNVQWLHKAKWKTSWLLPELIRKNIFKKAYYSMNTKRANPLNLEDRQVMAKLDKEFRPYNDALADLLNMNLSIWEKDSR